MVIEKRKEIEYKIDGAELEHVQMSIDQDSIDILMDFLSTGIYKDSIGSIIREVTSNGIDSAVKANNNTPVIVRLEQNNGQWQFIVEDTGVGLSKEDVNNILSKYLMSTKRSDNKQLGAKGIGFKVPMSYKDYFQFQCRKDGKETLCIMRKGDPLPEIDFIYEKDTTEPNGVKVIIDVDYNDRYDFSDKIRTQLIYFNNVYIIDNYSKYDNEYKIYKNDLFSYSKICSDSYLHLNFGGVYYPIDFDKLGIKRIEVPIAINIGLDDGIEPTLSREDVRYTFHAKEFILNKIKLISEWFVNEYNKTITEFNSFIEADSYINVSSHYVKLAENNIRFNDLIFYSSIHLKDPTIKGYNNTNLKLLLDRYNSILDIFDCVAEIDYGGRLSTKWVGGNIRHKLNPILISSTPIGNMREYLKYKYRSNVKFFKLQKPFKLFEGQNKDLNWYKALNLKNVDKKLWRPLIQDALKIQQEWLAKCDDQRNLEISKEWLEKRRQKRVYEGKLLNKQDGEITYFFTRKKEYGGYMFDKRTAKISSLGKEKKMIVYFNTDNKEYAIKKWSDIFIHFNSKVNFVLLNQREQKYVKNLHNYKTWREYMETNQFKKIATKMLAKKVREQYSNILNSRNFSTIIETLASNKQDVINRIETYIRDVNGTISDYAIDDLLKICEYHNLWDLEILADIKEMEKIAKKFDFINFLSIPHTYDTEEVKNKFAKYVAQYILFNKLYKNDFEQFEICVKAPIEETININEGELVPENLVEV
jgi:anti-sigma regulatory factor (Ser/Thr protein kinase)